MLLLCLSPAHGQIWGFEGDRRAFHGKIWEYALDGFAPADYSAAVTALLRNFEETTGRALAPGERGRAAIKVYTHSGPGMCTPLALTRAVIDELVARGFAREDLFIIDAREDRLRDCGYLPPLSRREDGPFFHGVEVRAMDSGRWNDEVWFYDSPLPREFTSPLSRSLLAPVEEPATADNRRSYLPAPLITEVDFWINLPMVSDHPALGLNGVLANATLWNISNHDRFFGSAANAPVAVAEIAAIPEIQAGWALTLLSLERFQYIGGPWFRSLYTRSERLLWMAVDPVILDTMVIRELNAGRREHGFREIGELLPVLEYCMELGLGYGVREQAEFIRVNDR